MANPWFRHYCGMMRDEKLVSVAVKSKQSVERVVWVYGAILESASEIDDGGRYDLDADEAAYFLRADSSDILAILAALTASGRLADGVVVNWSDRQFQSDKSSIRQAAYRERKRSKGGDCDVANSEGDVTPPSRDGLVTAQDTDTDTDIPLTPVGGTEGGVAGDGFLEFWEAYPKRDGPQDQQKAKVAYYAVMINTPPETLIQCAKSYADWCKKNGKTGTQYVKMAKFWLIEGHWREWEAKAVATVPQGVLVKRGTTAWQAWQGVKKTPCSDRYDGWFFPTEFPPSNDLRLQ